MNVWSITALMLLFAWSNCLGQVPQTEWASVFYGLSNPISKDCAVDELGNVYVIGEFSGSVDFDPGPSVFPLNSGNGNIYVVKLSNEGDLVWAKQFGGITALPIALEVDSSGNLLVAGIFYDVSVDFDPGPPVRNLDSIGGFILKLRSHLKIVCA